MAQSTVTQIKVLSDFAAETCEMIGRVSIGNADRLELLRKLRSDVEALERLTVKECRGQCGWTWQDIGDALGTTRQAAQQRFG
jgi:hypothetical protein